MARKFQNILETVGNTPVVKINKLAPADMNLYVKIEAFNSLDSGKDRLALGVIEAAECSGELRPGQTVIEATSGNTGIGLAIVCAQKGYPLVITMAETFSVERRKLMRFLGAKVVLTPAALRGMGMVTKVPPADSRSQISDFFIPWRRAPAPDEQRDPHQPPVGNFFLANFFLTIFTGARGDRVGGRRRHQLAGRIRRPPARPPH